MAGRKLINGNESLVDKTSTESNKSIYMIFMGSLKEYGRMGKFINL